MTHSTSQSSLDAFSEEALGQLDALYSTALRLTRRPADAEDLVQDTMLRAFRFSDRYEPGTNIRAWLVRILTNTFINKYRRTKRENETLHGDDAEPVGDGVMSRYSIRALASPENEMARKMLADEIEAALDELGPDYRAIIVLADLEELSYKEIAETLGVPIGTVMSRLHRARKQMQSRLMAQAIAMGIVPEEKENADAPVDFAEYAARKAARR